MSKFWNILIIGVQLGMTMVLLVCIYMIFALMDYQGGFDSLVGMIIFQPLIAVILSSITIVGCMVAGLPIRLIKSLNHWWTKHFYISILLTLIGLGFLVLSILPSFIQQTIVIIDDTEMMKSIPNVGFAIGGWFLTAFSALHIYPPMVLSVEAQKFLTNLTGVK